AIWPPRPNVPSSLSPERAKANTKKENKKRNETTQASAAIIPLQLELCSSCSKAKPQQRAARGTDSSASNNDNNNKFQGINLEAINASTGQEGEFSFLHAIFEMKRFSTIFQI
ncbi:hypothetical protein TNCV_3214801, partial [Trichonephila clavipes]